MDAKEAIVVLQENIKQVKELQDSLSGNANELCQRDIDGLFLAIEALEKQVPKEPIKRKIPGSCWYICPSCQKPLERLSKYCSCCSQAIKNDKE